MWGFSGESPGEPLGNPMKKGENVGVFWGISGEPLGEPRKKGENVGVFWGIPGEPLGNTGKNVRMWGFSGIILGNPWLKEYWYRYVPGEP